MSKKNRKKEIEAVVESSNAYADQAEGQSPEAVPEVAPSETSTEVVVVVPEVIVETPVEVVGEAVASVPETIEPLHVEVVEVDGMTKIDLSKSGAVTHLPESVGDFASGVVEAIPAMVEQIAPTATSAQVAAAVASYTKVTGTGKRVFKGNARGPKEPSEAWLLFQMLSEEPLTVAEAAKRLGRSEKRVLAHLAFWNRRKCLVLEDGVLKLTDKAVELRKAQELVEAPAETAVVAVAP